MKMTPRPSPRLTYRREPVFKNVVDKYRCGSERIFTGNTERTTTIRPELCRQRRPSGAHLTGAVSYDKSGNTAVQVASQPADKKSYNDYAEYNDGLLAAANPTVAKVKDIVYRTGRYANAPHSKTAIRIDRSGGRRCSIRQ